MSIIGPVQPADKASTVAAEIEGEIRELVQNESSRQAVPQPVHDDSESVARSISNTIQRITGTSAAQIDRLIVELTQLRDHLKDQGERVQSEIARVDDEIASYARASQTATQSIEVMDQSLACFKRAAGASETRSQAET